MSVVESYLLYAIQLGVVFTILFALIDCLRRKPAAFLAYGKLTKQLWSLILVASLFVAMVLGVIGSFIGPFAVVAAIVYLVDVKPAITGSNNPW